MKTRYVFELVDPHLPKTIGNKAKQLRFLSDKGFRIPGTLVCTWDAYAHYQADNVALVEGLRSALASHVDPGQSYAVRSSANIEDGLDHSFAGQFKSALNVHGVDGILQAVWSIWALTRAPNVQSYLRKFGVDPDSLKMAVVVQ